MEKKKEIVILGAGFGGIAAAKELARRRQYVFNYRVTVVDRSPHHVFTPLLYEMATGFMEHENIGSAKLLRSGITVENAELLSRWGADFVEADIEGIDWDKRRVLLRGRDPQPFDFLIIALGAETNFYGIEGMKERALTLKTLKDADRLRQRIHDLLHKGEKGLERKIDIVVGGGGATGVELAAEMTMFLRRHLIKKHLTPDDFQISVVEAASRVLGPMGPDLSEFAADRLRKLGIKLYLDTAVKKVQKGSVVIAPRPLRPGETVDQLVCEFRGEAGRTIDADILVWTGGIRGGMTLEKLGVKLDDRGKRIEVGPTLEVQDRKDAFAIGDAALLMNPKTKQPVPWLAQAAMIEGKTAAQTIINRLTEGADVPYPFPDFPTVVPLGGKYAVAKVGTMKFMGFTGWLIKEVANLRYFLNILPLTGAVRLWWHGAKLYAQND